MDEHIQSSGSRSVIATAGANTDAGRFVDAQHSRSRSGRALFDAVSDDEELKTSLSQALEACATQPQRLQAEGTALLSHLGGSLFVAGTVDNRILVVQFADKPMCYVGALNRTIAQSGFPAKLGIEAADVLSDSVWRVPADEGLIARLSRPRVVLVGLYHPENFPLPRFHLGISDIAYSLRSTFEGSVHLLDMQLDTTMADIVKVLHNVQPDIVGVSATFGQHDVLDAVLDAIYTELEPRPLVVCGGSLSALIAEKLLEKYPDLVVARGPGEYTMIDVVKNWQGACLREDITDAMIVSGGQKIRTKKLPNKKYPEGIPELDLLDRTLSARGVMQLESSRGCTYACSFCPREHKGMWVGYDGDVFSRLLPDISKIYEKHPGIARRIFLVDEEYVGYRADSEERGLAVANSLMQYGFRFETSTRVDQVVHVLRDKGWHTNRMRFWSDLVAAGLDRCLFGVESGVASILKRFNKRTTPRQNAQALRTLTALGVPIRATYITFDHLMTMDELLESFVFLGRRDVLLHENCYKDFDELYDIVTDDEAANRASSGKPFYSKISYMLVTMEALIGSKYLQYVEQAGLAGEYKLSMGCRVAEFLDRRIGIISELSQRLIDRNFSLDYMLKSLQKIAVGKERAQIDPLRVLLRSHSYYFLGLCLFAATGDARVSVERCPLLAESKFQALRDRYLENPEDLRELLFDAMSGLYAATQAALDGRVTAAERVLPAEYIRLIRQEMRTSQERGDWSLINAN